MKIQYFKHCDIDFLKWDECISRSLNGIIYAYSWYLNIVAGEWDALIGDDYNSVFPLVKNKKYGISYIFQPIFTQQLGVFSPGKVDQQILKLFIESIPKKYLYQEINFNSYNNLEYPKGKVKDRITYQLDLVQPYSVLSLNYSENTRRNISKSIALGVYVKKGLPIDNFIDFTRNNLVVALKDNQFDKLLKIIHQSTDKGVGEVYAAYTGQNELSAVAFFVRSNGKVIYLSAVSSEVGKTNRAMFALVDRFINDCSESLLILDFEGSNFESIARFYAGFGASRCIYQQLKINNLPWFLKPLKR